jgi:hypothetical protein
MVALFPGIEAYTTDYFNSVKNQLIEGVDLLILNDNFDINSIKSMPDSTVLEMPPNFSPAEIRQAGIKYSLEQGYKNIVFSDGDDYYSDNRIKESFQQLDHTDFVYNQVIPVDENGIILPTTKSPHFNLPDDINSVESLLDYNLFGMSNTAVVLDRLNGFHIPKGLVAVDWYLFTILLLNGARGKFIKNTSTYYRQTESNLVGMQKPLDSERLQVGVDVKFKHYCHVLDYCETHNMKPCVAIFARKKEQMSELKTALEDPDFKNRYIYSINISMEQIYKGWWSEILTLSEWNKL